MSVTEMILFAPVMFATLRRIPERTLRHWMYIWLPLLRPFVTARKLERR
jgi:hypothetical protein